jgi:apolipoprotein D and lipocalin family protein
MAKMQVMAALALILAMSGWAPAWAQAPAPSKPVDAAKLYSGVWAEIGRRPMPLTNGCVAGATRYTMTSPDKVEVRDTCHKGSPAGAQAEIGGPARIMDPGTNTRLRVSYRVFGFLPVTRDYWILDHADDDSWFISSDPRFENLWIYTRDPRVGPATRQALVERARALGYDVSRLEFPAQP